MNRKLKAAIVQAYGTQSDFAQAMRCPEAVVSKVVRGRRSLDEEEQTRWAQALAASKEELFEQAHK